MRKSVVGGLVVLFAGVGCAHPPVGRTPAEADGAPVKFAYRAELNVKGEPGALRIDAFAVFPARADVSFERTVDLFRGVNVSNDVNAVLVGYKDPPLDKIYSEVTLVEEKDKLTYNVFGYPKGFRIAGSRSRLVCPETYVREKGKGYWRQSCAADFSYKSTGDYLKAYDHVIECRELGKTIECSYRVDAVAKKIKVPLIAQILFSAKNYSATQAGYKLAENLLHSFYSLAKVYDQPSANRTAAKKAVEAYRSSEDYRQVTKLDSAYPKDIKALTGGSFASD